MTPLGFQLRNELVALILDKKKTGPGKVGSIYIPEGFANKDDYAMATVVAIGPGIINVQGARVATHDLKVGQRVWLQYKTKARGPQGQPVDQICGRIFSYDGQDYLLVHESEVLVIVTDGVEGDAPTTLALAD